MLSFYRCGRAAEVFPGYVDLVRYQLAVALLMTKPGSMLAASIRAEGRARVQGKHCND